MVRTLILKQQKKYFIVASYNVEKTIENIRKTALSMVEVVAILENDKKKAILKSLGNPDEVWIDVPDTTINELINKYPKAKSNTDELTTRKKFTTLADWNTRTQISDLQEHFGTIATNGWILKQAVACLYDKTFPEDEDQ